MFHTSDKFTLIFSDCSLYRNYIGIQYKYIQYNTIQFVCVYWSCILKPCWTCLLVMIGFSFLISCGVLCIRSWALEPALEKMTNSNVHILFHCLWNICHFKFPPLQNLFYQHLSFGELSMVILLIYFLSQDGKEKIGI